MYHTDNLRTSDNLESSLKFTALPCNYKLLLDIYIYIYIFICNNKTFFSVLWTDRIKLAGMSCSPLSIINPQTMRCIFWLCFEKARSAPGHALPSFLAATWHLLLPAAMLGMEAGGSQEEQWPWSHSTRLGLFSPCSQPPLPGLLWEVFVSSKSRAGKDGSLHPWYAYPRSTSCCRNMKILQ